MVFKRCCIKGVYYGAGTGDALTDPELVRAVMEKVPEVIKFLMVMAMCNTVTPCKRWAYFRLLIFLF
jgi:phospholipid-translocating ATPase